MRLHGAKLTTKIQEFATYSVRFNEKIPLFVIERSVQPGSIDLQWICEVAATAQTAFAALPALSFGIKDVTGLIKAWLDLLKFLKRQPPQKVQNVTNGNALQIENVTGQSTIINYNTFILNGIWRRC